MFSISKAFFSLPSDVKRKYKFDLVSCFLELPPVLNSCAFTSEEALSSIPSCDCAEGVHLLQEKNIGWESGQQKRASHNLPELKESLQLKWHDMDGKWPVDVPDFQATAQVISSWLNVFCKAGMDAKSLMCPVELSL